jgi:hypothetical protein
MADHFDQDSTLFQKETAAYELIDFLLHELHRVRALAMEARIHTNRLLPDRMHPIYPLLSENLYDCSLDDHPAIQRYRELYGVYAVPNV